MKAVDLVLGAGVAFAARQVVRGMREVIDYHRAVDATGQDGLGIEPLPGLAKAAIGGASVCVVGLTWICVRVFR